MESANALNYVSFDVNHADEGAREDCVKNPDCSSLLPYVSIDPIFSLVFQLCHSSVMVRRLCANEDLLSKYCTGLDHLINASPRP